MDIEISMNRAILVLGLLAIFLPVPAESQSRVYAPHILVTLEAGQNQAISIDDSTKISTTITDLLNGKCELKLTNGSLEEAKTKVRADGMVGENVVFSESREGRIPAKETLTHLFKCQRDTTPVKIQIFAEEIEIG